MKGFRIWVSILVFICFTVLIGCGGGSSDGVGAITNNLVKISTVNEMSESGISANEEHVARSNSAVITIPANAINGDYNLSINTINTANLDSENLSYLKNSMGFDSNVEFFSPIINYDISLVNKNSSRASLNINSDGFILKNVGNILLKNDKTITDWVNKHYYLAFCNNKNEKWSYTPLKKEHFNNNFNQLSFNINKIAKYYVIIAVVVEINIGLVPEIPEFTNTKTNTNTNTGISTNTNTSTSSSTSTSTNTNTQTQTQTNTNTSTNTNTDTDIVTGLNIYAFPETMIASDSGKLSEDMKIYVGLEYSGNNPFEFTTPSIEFLSFTPFDLGNSVKSNYQYDYYTYNYKNFVSPESDVNGIATFVLTLPTKNVKYDSNKHPANLFATAKFKSKSNKEYQSEPTKISFVYNPPVGKIPPSNLIVDTTFPYNSNYMNGSGSVDLALSWSGDGIPFTANFKYNNDIIHSVASITENSICVNIPADLVWDIDGEKYIVVEIVDSASRSTSALSKPFIIDSEPPVLVASITNGSVFSVRDRVQILITSNKPVTDPEVSCEGKNAEFTESQASNTRFIYTLQLNSDFTDGEHQINIVASDTTKPAESANFNSIIATFTVDTSITFPFANGSGTASDPFLIATAEDLNNIRFYPDYYYKQVADIDLGEFIASRTDTLLYPSDSDTNSTVGWLPIANFTGTYDGNNKYITNLFISRPDENYIGLFSTANVIINTRVITSDNGIIGNGQVGIISGNSNRIYNCYTEGLLKGFEIGGISGIGNQIERCCSVVRLEGTYCGGISNNGCVIINCLSNVDIIASSFCYSGGLKGIDFNGNISKCYSFGYINGTMDCGGIIGDIVGGNINYNISLHKYISGPEGYIGRITGSISQVADTSTIYDNYAWDSLDNDNDASNEIEWGDNVKKNGISASKSEFWGASTQQSFWVDKLGWDFDNVWEFRSGCNLPQLRGMPSIEDPDYLINAN